MALKLWCSKKVFSNCVHLVMKIIPIKHTQESEARYEIEQSTVTQRENDVKFDTGFKGQANLSSLEVSNL